MWQRSNARPASHLQLPTLPACAAAECSHNSVRGRRYSEVADEIVGLRDKLAKQCGISKE